MSEVRRRAVFHIGGYDPKTPRAFFERLDKEARRFEKTWGARVERGPIDHIDGVARSTVTTRGSDWTVTTDMHFFSLEPVVQRDFADPLAQRLKRYLVTFWDYVSSGTAFHFFRTNWRFALYFLYPIAMLTVFAGLAFLPWMIAAAIGIDGSKLLEIVLFGGLAALIFTVLLRTVGKRRYVTHLMDLWSFSRNWIRERRPDAEKLFDRYGRVSAQAAETGSYDEIVLIGHSTGGALILEIAYAALWHDPDLRRRADDVTVLTVGSTALKIGLHPAAHRFRERVQALHDAGLDWVEYQSLTDIINFEGTDPVAEMKLERKRKSFGHAQRVRIRDMLEADTYRRIRTNPFRVHYQFVFANTKRYRYDYHSICFAPMRLLERALNPRSVVERLS